MTCQQTRAGISGRLLFSWLAIACVGSWLTCAGGCGRSSPPDARPLAGDEKGASGEETTAQGNEAAVPGKQTPLSAEDVLRRMVAAYQKASSYADAGTVRLLAQRGDQQIDQTAKFSLALVRPNKFRAEVYEAMIVCDGKQTYAALEGLPNQVLVKDAPQELSVGSVCPDRLLASVMAQGFAGPLPQVILLLGESPLEAFLQGAQETTLGEPGMIDGRPCYRVEITRPEGKEVLWVDKQSFVLRRMVLPTDELRRALSRDGNVESISLIADFAGARLNEQIDPQAFGFETPAGAQVVKFFVPLHPAQLLGKRAPEFRFFDLAGNPVTPQSLAGKITVLDFWATWCEPCRSSLPELEKVRQHYKDNDKVAFFAVSVDRPDTTNAELEETLRQLAVQVPILRDTQENEGTAFNTRVIPAMFILDENGMVQDYQIGVEAKLATLLPEKLDKLLAAEDIFQGPLEEYMKQLEEDERDVAAADARAVQGAAPKEETIPIPQAKIAPRTQPQTLEISPLWQCTELKAPGNILPVEAGAAGPRLLVVDAWKSVAEVALDGKLIARHPLELQEMEVVSSLRAGAGADGKRYVVAFASAQQRLHLLDEDWNLVVSYPADALENRHSGIADVELGDLDGDGVLEVYVGYWDVIGVQAVSLEGKHLWSNRSVTNVVRMAIDAADPQGPGRLLCANSTGALAVIDAKGQRQGDIVVPDRLLHWIVGARLDASARLAWCGLVARNLGENVAIGLSLDGKELWSYPLPLGIHPQPIEPVIAGRLLPGSPGQWLLPGADGSIHIIAADGKPLDRFNYGATLTGLATVEVDGRPVLVVSSSEGLKAWQVE